MIFQDLPIKAPFRWRGETWVKIDAIHAVRENSPQLEDPEHVPSHETVRVETTLEAITEATIEQ